MAAPMKKTLSALRTISKKYENLAKDIRVHMGPPGYDVWLVDVQLKDGRVLSSERTDIRSLEDVDEWLKKNVGGAKRDDS